jgi:hypothetical protein
MYRIGFYCLAVLVSAMLARPTTHAQQIGLGSSAQSIGGGTRFGGNGVSGSLNFNFTQESSRFIGGTSQSMTTMNGVPGSFFSGELRPFVMGITPVVGNYPLQFNPMAEMAMAEQHAKLSAIAEGNAKLRNEKLRSYLVRAERAESEGNLKMARANYRLALGQADEPLRSMIQTVLNDRFSGRPVSAKD